MALTSIRTGELRNAAGNDAAIISTVDNNIEIMCFAAGTLITVAGHRQVPVEALIEGDLGLTVGLTADRGLRPVLWIGRRALSRAMLHRHPHLRAIRIAPDALGPSLPEQPLYLSPQHRVLVRSKIARRMFGEAEVLVAAGWQSGNKGTATTWSRQQRFYRRKEPAGLCPARACCGHPNWRTTSQARTKWSKFSNWAH